MTRAQLDELARRFVDRTLPRAEWTHAAHLAVGAWHVHHFGAAVAIDRLRLGIRALNGSHGTPNTPTSGYHETITVAYARLLERALADLGADTPLELRVAQILSGPLADKSFLFRHWSRNALLSPAARAQWVPPDLADL